MQPIYTLCEGLYILATLYCESQARCLFRMFYHISRVAYKLTSLPHRLLAICLPGTETFFLPISKSTNSYRPRYSGRKRKYQIFVIKCPIHLTL